MSKKKPTTDKQAAKQDVDLSLPDGFNELSSGSKPCEPLDVGMSVQGKLTGIELGAAHKGEKSSYYDESYILIDSKRYEIPRRFATKIDGDNFLGREVFIRRMNDEGDTAGRERRQYQIAVKAGK